MNECLNIGINVWILFFVFLSHTRGLQLKCFFIAKINFKAKISNDQLVRYITISNT